MILSLEATTNSFCVQEYFSPEKRMNSEIGWKAFQHGQCRKVSPNVENVPNLLEAIQIVWGVDYWRWIGGIIRWESSSRSPAPPFCFCAIIIIVIIIVILIVITIITRSKPAYGRQGLAGLWGQDTDQAGTFWGVLNVSLHASGAQLGRIGSDGFSWHTDISS